MTVPSLIDTAATDLNAVLHGDDISVRAFFRLVEHRLQMMHQIQTHSIPESSDDVRLLADRVSHGPLGSYTHETFVSTLAAHLNKVRVLGDSFFSGEETPDVSLLLLSPEEDETAERILAQYGLKDAGQTLPIVLSLAYGSFPDLVDRNTRTSFQSLLPDLLEEGSRTGDPAGTLVNFSKIAGAIKSRRALYDFLADSSSARHVIRDLTGTSSILTNLLCGSPEIIDTLFEEPEQLVRTPTIDEIPWSSGTTDASAEERMKLSRVLRKGLERRLIGAWALDTSAHRFPETVSQTLTTTARDWITTLHERMIPKSERVVMYALGSYAIGEPGLHSDVDLIVATDGGKIERITTWTQQLNQIFLEGPVFKLDFRLRGEGENAPLIQDIALYKKYFDTRMSAWEKVAFGKCVLWTGDAEIGKVFTAALQHHLSRPFESSEVETLLQTRRKIEGLVSKNCEFFDTKRPRGGRYDIDYFCALALSKMGTPFPFQAGTIERLGLLTDAGMISDEENEQVRQAFELYRRVDYLMDLQGWPLPNNARKRAELARYLDRTFELLGFPVAGSIEKRLAAAKNAVRRVYDKVFGG